MCEVPVHIEMMRQKAKIKVNEEGSEAAAVTVGGIYENSGPSIDDYPKATFHANEVNPESWTQLKGSNETNF